MSPQRGLSERLFEGKRVAFRALLVLAEMDRRNGPVEEIKVSRPFPARRVRRLPRDGAPRVRPPGGGTFLDLRQDPDRVRDRVSPLPLDREDPLPHLPRGGRPPEALPDL